MYDCESCGYYYFRQARNILFGNFNFVIASTNGFNWLYDSAGNQLAAFQAPSLHGKNYRSQSLIHGLMGLSIYFKF